MVRGGAEGGLSRKASATLTSLLTSHTGVKQRALECVPEFGARALRNQQISSDVAPYLVQRGPKSDGRQAWAGCNAIKHGTWFLIACRSTSTNTSTSTTRMIGSEQELARSGQRRRGGCPAWSGEPFVPGEPGHDRSHTVLFAVFAVNSQDSFVDAIRKLASRTGSSSHPSRERRWQSQSLAGPARGHEFPAPNRIFRGEPRRPVL